MVRWHAESTRGSRVSSGMLLGAEECGLRRRSGRRCDGHLVSHGLQVVDQSAFACFGIVVAGEVVRTHVEVGGTVVQDMPDDHDEGVGDRDGGLPTAHPVSYTHLTLPTILR